MNEKLEKMKSDYMKINASDKLKEKINTTIKESKRNRIYFWKIFPGLAACLIFFFIMSLNFSKFFAATISKMPGMNEIVRFLTFDRYVVNDNGYHADIKTPKIEGLLDKKIQDKINKDFKDNADAIIVAFESDMKELKEKFPDEKVNLGIEQGYVVKTDSVNFLAIDVYMANTVGSSSTTHKFYTIDKKSKAVITLASLFKKDSNYLKTLSDYIKTEMRRQNEKGNIVFWVDDPTFGPFKGIKENQNFYINNEGKIVICFDKYEVAPGAYGSPEFVIPKEVVKDILSNLSLY